MAATQREARPRTGRARVLVLGLDPLRRLGLARAVRRRGLPVAAARGCADAVDRMVGARPALVVMDTRLPGWLDLLFSLRAAFAPPVPVVLTGPRGRPGAESRLLPLCFHVAEPTSHRAVAALVVALAGRAGPAPALHPRPRRPADGEPTGPRRS
jgi:CheY-like chemotaxis protein